MRSNNQFLSDEIRNRIFAEEMRNIKYAVRDNDVAGFNIIFRNSGSKEILSSHLIGELSCLHYAAILGDREYVLEAFDIPKAEFSDFSKVSGALAIVNMSYSTHDAPMEPQVFTEILKKSIAAIDFDFRAKEIFLDVLEKVNSGEKIKIANGKEIELVKSVMPNHASYYIIESDETGPQRLSYCDSVFNLRNGFGEIVCAIDPEKLQKLAQKNHKKNPEEALKHEIFCRSKDESFQRPKIVKLVKCYDLEHEGEEPEILEKNIPITPQKRGNCSFKSFNILARAVMQKIHPQEMDFALDDGMRQSGKGYDIYQSYKQPLQQNAIETLLEFSQEQYRGSVTHSCAVGGLQQVVFLQTILKEDRQLFNRVAEALFKNDIDALSIKDQQGQTLEMLFWDAGWKDLVENFAIPNVTIAAPSMRKVVTIRCHDAGEWK